MKPKITQLENCNLEVWNNTEHANGITIMNNEFPQPIIPEELGIILNNLIDKVVRGKSV